MRKSILVLLVLIGISASLGLHYTTTLAQNAAEPAQSAIEQQAVRIYNNLHLLSIRDRKELFNGLTPELKSELWKIQYRSYLSRHPGLTVDQRQAIEAAISHFTPQIYKIPEGTAEWEEKVHKPTQLVTNGIFAVFPPVVAKELVTVLGGSDSPQSFNLLRINSLRGIIVSGCAGTRRKENLRLIKTPVQMPQQTFRMVSASLEPEDCDCSTRSPSDCPDGTTCEPESCYQQPFCGAYYLYICNGLCIYNPCVC